MTIAPRRIIHVDMDAFFAAVEQHDFPELRGKPVIVGGPRDGRGVVATASYEARRYGVHSAMPSRTAYRLCPDAIFVKPRFERYREISQRVMEIFSRYTDLIEPLSIDEAYLDVTVNKMNIPLGKEVAKRIRAQIVEETGLTASAGVAPNKFLAKIASGYRKPDGLTVIAPERMEDFLADLAVRNFPGVGPVTERKLHELGLRTATELRQWSEQALIASFGKYGGWLYRVCRGEDNRLVNSDRDRKSLGAEDTFESDITETSRLLEEIDRIAEIVARRLGARGLAGPTVTLKVTLADFTKFTRSHTGRQCLSSAQEIADKARLLFLHADALRNKAVRLVGIQISGFEKRQVQSAQFELPFS